MSEPLGMNVDFEMSDTEMNLEADMNCNIEVPLPIASATQLGGIKVGENLSIAADGTLSAEGSPVVVDDTLTIAGAAADAKKTGDEITALKEELNTNVTNVEGAFETGDIELYAEHNKWYHGYFDASGNLIVNGNNASPTNGPFLVKAGLKLQFDPNGYAGNIFEYSKSGNTYVRTRVIVFNALKEIEYANDAYITVHFGGTGIPLNNGCHIISQTSISKDMQEMNTVLTEHDVLLDTVKIRQYKDDIKLNGIVHREFFSTNYANREEHIIQLDLVKGHAYVLSTGLHENAQNLVNISLKDASGNNLQSIYVNQGAKVARSAGPYVSNSNYENAFITVTVSAFDGDVGVDYVEIIDLSSALKPTFFLRNAILVSVDEENQATSSNVLFIAKEVVIKTNGESVCGLEFNLKEVKAGQYITIESHRNVGNNISMRVLSYDSSNAVIKQNQWFTQTTANELQYIIPQNADRIVIDFYACYGTALPTNTEVTFTDIKIVLKDADGTGYSLYTGQKIQLPDTLPSTPRKCSISLWKTYTKAEYPDLPGYELHYNQSMAIYNDVMFLLNSGGTGVAVDYQTKNILSQITYTPTDNQHANSAQFTDIFYSDSDEFPILMISRCGNTAHGGETTDPIDDEVTFLRVIRNGNDFTLTELNSARFMTQTYGSTWGYDPTDKTLHLVAYKNGDLDQLTDNPMCIRSFRMPTKQQILSGEPVELIDSDVINTVILEHVIFQGGHVFGAYFYLAVQTGSNHIATVWAIDMKKNRVASSVILASNLEPEGLSLYNGKMYVSQKNGADTTSVNPVSVYELEF